MLPYIFVGFAFFTIAYANQVAFQKRPGQEKRPGQDISFLSKGDIEAFKPYSFYSAAAYCGPSVMTWSCGCQCHRLSLKTFGD